MQFHILAAIIEGVVVGVIAYHVMNYLDKREKARCKR